MIGKIIKTERLTDNIISFWFQPESKFSYLAGQYTDILMPNCKTSHWYTLSSSPTEELCCFTTKFVEPLSDFKKELLAFKPGDAITYSDAIGDYVLPKDSSAPILFIAGGIGITPVRSVIKFLIDTNEKRSINLIYAVRVPQDLIYDSLLKSYAMNYVPIVRNPSADWTGAAGQLTSQRLPKLTTKLTKNAFVFISGPQSMVEELTDDLSRVINRSQIIMDYFPGYLEL